ncbi:MAG: hypothetical protein RMN51_08495 [Verrucomicrobiota bacterium]|nr:hypothetical protein [Limisphaera sp.]MDW8382128.1 hypothetical protein [Verrucomicrobiota bacterium]
MKQLAIAIGLAMWGTCLAQAQQAGAKESTTSDPVAGTRFVVSGADVASPPSEPHLAARPVRHLGGLVVCSPARLRWGRP